LNRLLVILLVLFAAAPLLAAIDDDPYLKRARSLMDDAEYESAQRTLRKGLAREEVYGSLLVEHYRLEAVCWVSLGEDREARSSFVKLLTVEPGFRPGSDISPKVRAVFDETYEEMKKSGALRSEYEISHTPIGTRIGGRRIDARLELKNETRAGDIDRVVLYLRRLGDPEFTAIDGVVEDGAYAIGIPAYLVPEERETYAVEYFIDVVDASGARVAGIGQRDLPLSFRLITQAEYDAPLEEPQQSLLVPIIAGSAVGVGAVVIAGVIGTSLFLFLPRTGSADVVVAPPP